MDRPSNEVRPRAGLRLRPGEHEVMSFAIAAFKLLEWVTALYGAQCDRTCGEADNRRCRSDYLRKPARSPLSKPHVRFSREQTSVAPRQARYFLFANGRAMPRPARRQPNCFGGKNIFRRCWWATRISEAVAQGSRWVPARERADNATLCLAMRNRALPENASRS